ncbi:MAG: hypothetical protein AAF919_02720 [Pseudomonadota bacterium]
MTVENPSRHGGTGGATALHLGATFVLFVVLNFLIGAFWSNFVRPAPPADPSGTWVMDAVYGFLTYGVALWLALEGPRLRITRSRVGIVAVAGVILSLAMLLVRLFAVISILSSLGPGDQEIRNYVWLSVAMIGFQTFCSLAAIWLFYARHKDDGFDGLASADGSGRADEA